MSATSAITLAAAYDLTSGRLAASLSALVGLAGVIVGGLVLAGAHGRIGIRSERTGATAALAAGVVALVAGGVVIATADGGVGSGSGLAGAYVAVVLGLAAAVIGGLARGRSRRAGAQTVSPRRGRG
ncbi:DUF6223 family protein [Streptomyces sp. NPDC051940]|uniref:DUF6223 family protein n=1 Tax=Streptomyces sp. NPDC051940 TaxID=3155675 RepID=UPI003441BA9F